MSASAVNLNPADEAETLAALLPIDAQIRHFLAGETDGAALLGALYDHVLDEPAPERLLRILRG
jgi:hypothetical protein